MTDTELKSCIGTIEMLRRLHGVMNVIDAGNCEKIIKVLSDHPKYKDAYNKGWDDGAKATYEHLKMCEEEQETDVLDKIRAEIEALHPVDYVSMSSYEGHIGASDMKGDVLQIIDKYKAESDNCN